MKVAVYSSDTSGCGYYRMLEPVEAAKRAGVDATAGNHFPSTLKQLPNGAQRVTGLSPDFDADVVVFHRPLDYLIADSIKHLRKAGIGVVVDLDDDIWSANRETMFWQVHHPDRNARENFVHCQRACKYADFVTCSVPIIAKRWGYGHGVVVPNGIPLHVLEMEHTGGGGIGWAGEIISHAGDLRVCGDGVQRAMESTGLPFLHVGVHPREVAEELDLAKEPRTVGWTTPGKHFRNVARIDIGIAPLADTPSANTRSGVKVLEYAALGIPSVASPQSEYLELGREGLCAIARTPDEWKLFIESAPWPGTPSADHLREVVRQRHTTDITITRAIDVWEMAAAKAQRRLDKRTAAL